MNGNGTLKDETEAVGYLNELRELSRIELYERPVEKQDNPLFTLLNQVYGVTFENNS